MTRFHISKFFLMSLLFSILLGAVSAFKPIDLLPDMSIYKEYFYGIVSGADIIVEPSYVLVSKISYLLGVGFPFVIFIYFFFSLSIKAYVIRKNSERYVFALLYITSYMLLHEFIQIRIGIAISMLFLGCYLHFHGRTLSGAAVILSAALFHVSAIIFPIIFYFSVFVSNKRVLFILPMLVIISFVAALNDNFNALKFFSLLPSAFQYKINLYVEMQSYLNEYINIFSVRLLIFYFVIALLWHSIDRLIYTDKIILIVCTCFIIIMLFSVSLPSLALRVVEIAGPFFILLIARLRRYFAKPYVYAIWLVTFLSNIYYSYSFFG